MFLPKPLGPRSKSRPSDPAAPSLSLTFDISNLAPIRPLATRSNSINHNDVSRFSGPTPVLLTPIPRKASTPRIRLPINRQFSDPFSQEERTIRPPHQHHQSGFISSSGNSSWGQPDVNPLREAVQMISHSRPRRSSSLTSASSSSSSSDQQMSPQKRKEFSDEDLEVVDRLGEGTGGAVHKVRDTRDGSIYARKTITTREVSWKQVVRELNIISAASHDNIVQCFGAYMSPSSSEVKIVMENCDGGSLEAISKQLKEVGAVIGEKTAGRIAEGVLQGLAYLHSKKTIHRDIKPSNILLSKDGVVKLCDFGVSGELVNSKVGTFTGTLIYMAPERAKGGEYNVRSDVWSTGISLLELVSNRFPFPADLPTFELILLITRGEPPTLEDKPEENVTWSDDMKDFFRQTLIRDPQLRPTPEEMLQHPWIKFAMRQEVNMARWIDQVWSSGKKKPGRRQDGERSVSRPSTGKSDTSNSDFLPHENGLVTSQASSNRI